MNIFQKVLGFFNSKSPKEDFSFISPVDETIVEQVKEKEKESKKEGIEWATNAFFQRINQPLDVGLYPYHQRDEILTKEGISDAERVLRDPMVKACMHTLVFNILKKPFAIESVDQSPEALQAKDFVDYIFKNLKGNIQKNLYPLMVSGIHFGYGLSEKVYVKVNNDERFNGWLTLQQVKSKKIGLYSFDLDDYDNILAVQSLATFEGKNKYLPTDKFLIYSFLPIFENPYGAGAYASLQKWVYSKNHLIQQMLISNTKFASDTVGVEIPSGQLDDQQAIEDAQMIADAIQSGNAVAYPQGIKISTFGSSKTQDVYLPRLHYIDSQIALILLGNDLTNKASTGSGTHAETKEKSKVTSIYSDFIQTDIEELINESIIRDLLTWNTNIPVNLFPKFKFIENKKELEKEHAETIKTYIDSQVLKPTERVSDEVFIRSEGNLPALSDDEIKARSKV